MQVPDHTFRPLGEGEQVRADEVEVTASQKARIESILRDRLEREAMLAARSHHSKGSRRRTDAC